MGKTGTRGLCVCWGDAGTSGDVASDASDDVDDASEASDDASDGSDDVKGADEVSHPAGNGAGNGAGDGAGASADTGTDQSRLSGYNMDPFQTPGKGMNPRACIHTLQLMLC